jgi:hypothetical protein
MTALWKYRNLAHRNKCGVSSKKNPGTRNNVTTMSRSQSLCRRTETIQILECNPTLTVVTGPRLSGCAIYVARLAYRDTSHFAIATECVTDYGHLGCEHHVVSYMSTNVSDKHAASIFKVGGGGCRFPRNDNTCILLLRTRRYISEDCNFNTHRRENLKPYTCSRLTQVNRNSYGVTKKDGVR